jgi:2-alkenal reductase
VLAIGSALGEFRNSVTSGVVSALGRTIQESAEVSLHGMIQTDAAINQGNSGGPLLNDRGEVVGINTAVNRGSTGASLFGATESVVAEGLGFAIPSDTARNVAARLMQNKPTAELGIRYVEVSEQLSTYYGFPVGAYVQSVVPGTSAATAGLKERDIVTKIDGHQITDQASLQQIIASKAPGDTVQLSVWRNGKTLQIAVKLGKKS